MSEGKDVNNRSEDLKADLNENLNQTSEGPEVKEAVDSKNNETTQDEGSEEETSKENQGSQNEASKEEEDADTKYMRLMADFQNFKRRTEKEKGDIYAFANEKIIGELLAVIDNFDRAMTNTQDVVPQGFVTGMDLILKQLKEVLEKSGLEEILALGEDFDPNYHNAVMTEESSEYEEGKVSEVLQKGYLLNKKVIRPTMVKVVR